MSWISGPYTASPEASFVEEPGCNTTRPWARVFTSPVVFTATNGNHVYLTNRPSSGWFSAIRRGPYSWKVQGGKLDCNNVCASHSLACYAPANVPGWSGWPTTLSSWNAILASNLTYNSGQMVACSSPATARPPWRHRSRIVPKDRPAHPTPPRSGKRK